MTIRAGGGGGGGQSGVAECDRVVDGQAAV